MGGAADVRRAEGGVLACGVGRADVGRIAWAAGLFGLAEEG